MQNADWSALPHHPYQVLPSTDHLNQRMVVNRSYAEVRQACCEHPYLSAKLRVVQDPRSPEHWFVHFKNLEATPFNSFKSGIYGHIQFCSVGRMDKKKNRPFLVKQPAVGILTPTEIFTSYKPDGSFSTGAKDIGIPGVCGTAHADEHIYRMAMNDVYESRPLQTGATYTWTSKSGVGASVTAHEDVLQVSSSGGEYGLYLCPIIRYSGSIVRWLEQLVKLLDLNVSPRGPLVGTGFDGVKPFPTAQAISDAAAASDDWAQTAYGGQLTALFDSVYTVQPPLERALPMAPSLVPSRAELPSQEHAEEPAVSAEPVPQGLAPPRQLATEGIELPASTGRFDLFHSNLFSGHGYNSALGANTEGMQWVSHYGQFSYLPTGTAPDAELTRAWRDLNEAAWKQRTKQLCGPGFNADSVAKGQVYQWICMRKGDVVMVHKADEFVLGVFEHEPWEAHAMFWSTLSDLGVDPICPDDLHVRRAFRRVSWRRVGLQPDLQTRTKQYLRGFRSSTAMRARDPDDRRFVYADLLRCSRPILEHESQMSPPPATREMSPHPEAQPLRSDVLSADTPLPPDVPLLAMHPSAEDEQELVPSLAGHLVIGDLIDGGSALATGVLVNGAASTAADATVELSDVSACVTVKVDPEDAAVHRPIRQGRVPSYPRALAVQPVLEAMGSLQAPRRRAREQPDAPQAEPPRSSRSRREAPPTASFCRGQRVSCVFEHNGAPTAFHGAVMRVHDEFWSCDVDFDDGRSHRVAMARLTCL